MGPLSCIPLVYDGECDAAEAQILVYSNDVLSSPAWSGNLGFYK